jgi:hypothetical protein
VEDVRHALTERNVALCVADRRGPITPLWRTADWTYVRFHAGRAMPRSCYGASELETWAERLAGWGRDATGFVYFNNDGNGCALRDASVFARALDERGVELASIPAVPEDVLLDPGIFEADAEGRAQAIAVQAWGPTRAASRLRRQRLTQGGSSRCRPR